MGKKKPSLKPVNRGVATTSVQSKKAKPEPVAADSAASLDPSLEPESDKQGHKSSEAASSAPVTTERGEQAPDNGHETTADDWDNEQAINDSICQGLVDRLQDKADKEVARIIRTLETDKRFASTFTFLPLNKEICDRAIQYRLEDIAQSEGTGVKALGSSSTLNDSDKTLLRTYITYHVLSYLGFASQRIEQCILEGLREGEGWAEGEEWMWLNLSEEECRQVGKLAPQTSSSDNPSDAPLVDVEPEVQVQVPKESGTGTTPTPSQQRLHGALGGSMFQSLTSTASDSESDSDEDPNLNKSNESWAKLMLELDGLRIQSGREGKVKGNKKASKGSGVVIETPEMVKVKNKMTKIEKDYMFSRKEADALFRAMKSRRDMDMLQSKLSKSATASPPSGRSSPSHDAVSTSDPPHQKSILDSELGDEDDVGLFGNMLDEPEPSMPSEPAANTSVAVRSMPVPRQFAMNGNSPKALLRSAVSMSSKQGVIAFARLSPNPRVARSGLEVRWSADKKHTWRMEDFACESVEEADNCVSTMALHDMLKAGDIPSVNWRVMPPACRQFWEELEDAHAEKTNADKREAWKSIKDLVDRKLSTVERKPEAFTSKSQPTSNPVSATPSRPKTPPIDDRLRQDFERRVESPAYQKMRKSRDTLPIAPYREEIIQQLEKTQVLVFSGETGCGKSTQLPSYILEDQLSKGKPCKIFVTEPRRISAISLAQRVSIELGEAPSAMGGNSSLVGYSIRLESKLSANTRLAFVTNGIALRMLEAGSGSKGSSFNDVTHIIVDEVHERSIESDFLLIVLKQLLQVRKDLKVILMSATVDAEKISKFFGNCPFMQVPGRTFPVQINYLEDAVELAGWHIDESSPYAVWDRHKKGRAKQLEWMEEGARSDGDTSGDDAKPEDPTKLSSSKYSARTVSTVNLLDSRKIPYDLIVQLLERICFEDPNLQPFSAATLVFMPGLAEIRKLNDELQAHPQFGSSDFVIYPLHSTISSDGQSSVFQIPPKGVRKIVISTNIAETGVTIPDITCVIDSGKQREMRYDEKRQLSRLVETYISRSNAKQRRGRAGRVQEGLAFHLFTKVRHDIQLPEHPIPEMLRLSLQDLALRIKILEIKLGDTVEEVLLQALDPPLSINIQRAVAALVEVKALTPNEEITTMGRLLSKLPMDVHLGKFLLVAALFRCLDPALTIAATLNSKSPFIAPFGFESQADAAKKSFAVDNSDFLTIANVFDCWRKASDSASTVRTFCRRNFVSHQNLQQIEELRQQLLSYLIDTGFVEVTPEEKKEIARARYNRGFKTRFVTVPPQFTKNGADKHIISAALASGLYPKVLAIEPSGTLRTISKQQPVAIHPSSANFGVPKTEFGTSHLVYFTLMQSKKLYAWETGPVEDRILALLCGDLLDLKLSASSLQIDRKLRFRIDPKSAIALKLLREQLAAAMTARLRGRTLSARQQEWFDLAMACITMGPFDSEQSIRVV